MRSEAEVRGPGEQAMGTSRVSKQEQHEALQIDALKEAGCEKWFLDSSFIAKSGEEEQTRQYVRSGSSRN